MKQILVFLALLVFCACGKQNGQTKASEDTTSLNNSNTASVLMTDERVGIQTTDSQLRDWEKNQDSLRSKILNGKQNNALKESLLQEMYIRNVATISNDSVVVNIPFNLHGPDCVAPDCYSMDVRFVLKLGDRLIFPASLAFNEHQHGCVEKEYKLSGVFRLVEETARHVIYYSGKHKRTLVLFSSNKENGTTAFYFTNLNEKRINGQNVYNIRKEYNEEDEDSIYPFTSWALTTNEYENFVN